MNVLALEPDSTQAEAIRHVVCNLVGARLTVAASIGQALHLVRESTPDLVLLPALVSPSQESVLLQTLHSLPGASHVETQITPVLPPRDELIVTPHGWRRWTRRASSVQAESAESSAFAERLHWALERARERKAHRTPRGEQQGGSLEQPRPAATEPVADLEQVSVALLEASPDSLTTTLIEPVMMSLDVDAPREPEASRSLMHLLDGLDGGRVSVAEDLELADATSRLLKKLSQSSASDRRQYRRFAANELPGLRSARIKFGPNVALVDVSAGGALLETDARLQPDSEALLELVGSTGQAVVPFRVVRCQIAALNGAPRYLGACAFTQPLDLDELSWTAAVGMHDPEARVPALTLVSARAAARNAW